MYDLFVWKEIDMDQLLTTWHIKLIFIIFFFLFANSQWLLQEIWGDGGIMMMDIMTWMFIGSNNIFLCGTCLVFNIECMNWNHNFVYFVASCKRWEIIEFCTTVLWLTCFNIIIIIIVLSYHLKTLLRLTKNYNQLFNKTSFK